MVQVWPPCPTTAIRAARMGEEAGDVRAIRVIAVAAAAAGPREGRRRQLQRSPHTRCISASPPASRTAATLPVAATAIAAAAAAACRRRADSGGGSGPRDRGTVVLLVSHSTDSENNGGSLLSSIQRCDSSSALVVTAHGRAVPLRDCCKGCCFEGGPASVHAHRDETVISRLGLSTSSSRVQRPGRGQRMTDVKRRGVWIQRRHCCDAQSDDRRSTSADGCPRGSLV